MSQQLAAPAPRVLADVLPRWVPAARAHARVTDAALVLAGTLFMAGMAQLIIPLPFTPVPISLGTMAALMTGAALGVRRGGASVGLYLIAGLLGAPFFSAGQHGWQLPTLGYALAYLPAALLVGHFAQRRADRSPVRLFGVVAAGSALLYLGGVPWLMARTGMDLSTALAKGMLPFLPGDLLKALAISGLLPTTWALLRRLERR